MSGVLSESNIVRALAEETAQRITRRARSELQKMNHTLSGDDSVLKTTWDEICVQVQDERSIYWDAYDRTVRYLLEFYVDELAKHEQEALWLQTEEAWDRNCEESEERAEYPVSNDEIVDYIIREYVYEEAEQWSNARIRTFIYQGGMRD